MADQDRETLTQVERRPTGDQARIVRFDAPQQIGCGPHFSAPDDPNEEPP